jgi:hypothetical protein
MAPLDYRTARPKLKSNGIDVTRLTVVGLLAEKAIKICRSKRVGKIALCEKHLPDAVTMTLDGKRGTPEVMCHPDDKVLAVAVAKAVRQKMHSLGLEMVQALLEVKMDDERVGDHDVIYEVVDVSCVGEEVEGFLSVEVKCRHLWSPKGREDIRLLLRSECCDDLPWWTQQERGKYAGRAIVMVIFESEDSNEFKLCGDIKLNTESKWRGWFGWGGSRNMVSSPAQQRQAQFQSRPAIVSAVAAGAKAKAKGKAKTRAIARPANAIATAVDRLDFRSVAGVLCVEVGDLCAEAGKNIAHASYWATKAKKDHHWGDSDLFQAARTFTTSTGGRTRRKLGGIDTWFATRRVCLQMIKDWTQK